MALSLKQFFEHKTSTYTYLLYDPATLEAMIIDPVQETFARDLETINELGLKIKYLAETHVHADHITSAGRLRKELGGQIVVGKNAPVVTADQQLDNGSELFLGEQSIQVLLTPGHTTGCTSYYSGPYVFTGDALLIRGCGRTDFQGGDSGTLYTSIHQKIFTLPEETIIYPGHDYKGRTSSTVGEEKRFNPRLGGGRTKEEFQKIMANLDLSPPSQIDVAVPGNLRSGI